MADQKDRRTRGNSYETVNAPPKKGGAGAHNWGSPTDVQDMGYVSYGAGQVRTVTVQPAPSVVPMPAATNGGYQVRKEDFPRLAPGPAHVWQGPIVKTDPNNLRTGATELFDSSHPRHLFAPKPHHSTTTVQTVGAAVPNGTSTTTVVNNAAHLTKYQQAPSPEPLSKHIIQNVAPVYQVVQPKISYTQQSFQKPRPQIIQPRR
eukprot:TRINITY_DN950_c8_g1_i1.p1 TRINITY_DN950_c8_g1~~TRINITY_DN950_c8_g1_i1.p1  ORF type:complete len:230 (+),score=39.58 TRINITY_DN950_c8_g1_i1:79-690(+)